MNLEMSIPMNFVLADLYSYRVLEQLQFGFHGNLGQLLKFSWVSDAMLKFML